MIYFKPRDVEFCLDRNRRELRRDGKVIPEITQQKYEVLRTLAENPGVFFSTKDLKSAVWPGTSISDDAVHQAVKRVRALLSDESDEQGASIIQNRPGLGYRFVAKIIPPPTPELTVKLCGVTKTTYASPISFSMQSTSTPARVLDAINGIGLLGSIGRVDRIFSIRTASYLEDKTFAGQDVQNGDVVIATDHDDVELIKGMAKMFGWTA